MTAARYTLKDVLASSLAAEEIANRFISGETALYPTETIYGIGGRADNQSVQNRIFEAKNRPQNNPLILIASSPALFEHMGVTFPPPAQKLARVFWPGKLTLVLPVRDSKETLAVRTSEHPFIVALFQHLAVPIFSTSANLSSQPYNGKPDHLWKTFQDRVDFFVDAGDLPASQPSTVVRVFEDCRVEVLREGIVTAAEVQRALS